MNANRDDDFERQVREAVCLLGPGGCGAANPCVNCHFLAPRIVRALERAIMTDPEDIDDSDAWIARQRVAFLRVLRGDDG